MDGGLAPLNARSGMPAMMARTCIVVELKIFAEHMKKVLFETHHKWMDPCVENDIGAFPTHLGGVAGREILHMYMC